MAATYLTGILSNKRVEVEARKEARSIEDVRRASEGAPPARDFRGALLDGAKPGPRVIAEIKRRSPSKGPLRLDLDPVEIARIYEANGAAAISVLADNRFFGGSLDDLSAARAAVRVPVLCKEFIIDPYQLYEARAAAADAVLLIAAALTEPQLRDYRVLAAGMGMASLVEIHNEAELESALSSGADIVGINNRNLSTFEVSLEVTARLIPQIPSGIVRVSESGIFTEAHRARMADLGADALLVGESLITSQDIAVATRLICGVTAGAAALTASIEARR